MTLYKKVFSHFCALLGLLTLFLTPVTAGAAEWRVDGPAALETTLARTKPGDVLLLAAGDYGPLSLSRGISDRHLTLRAADPKQPPRFTRLNLTDGEGLVLEDLRFIWQAGPEDRDNTRVSTITGGHGITLRRVLFAGDIARSGADDTQGRGMGFGLFIRWVNNLLIEDSEIRTWGRGMVISESDGITLRGNEVHAIRSDGIDFAQVSNVLIEDNHFHDFDRAVGSGDHADMIQFWTNRTTKPSTGIRIRDNLFNSGHGFYTHTIFMRNEEVDTGRAGRDMFYRDVEITGNIIINAHLHGISIGETENLLIASNTLVRNRLSQGSDGNIGLWTPSIRVATRSENVSILRNITPRMLGPDKRPDWKVQDNLIIQDSSPAGPGYYDKVFASAISGDPAALASFVYREGGPADGIHVGAPGLRADQVAKQVGGEDGTLAVMQVNRDPSYVNRFHFDADQARMTKGTEPAWDFGDGTGAQGLHVGHDFAHPGGYDVTLRTGPDPADTAYARIVVPDPQLLRFDPRLGLVTPSGQIAGGATAGEIRIGGNATPVEVANSLIAGLYGAPDFSLEFDLATIGGGNPAGEILRVHEAFVLSMTPTGQLTLSLFTAGSRKARVLNTPPSRRLNDGAVHRIAIHVTQATTEIRADGQLVLGVRGGSSVPKVNRPLVLGGAFGKVGVPARITALNLSAGQTAWAR